ncbi:hypothetical protein ACOKFD_13820 [Flagellimonas sp. S174]|uniref:hypothetical protein n=1 Tax=Flagellimonas sp. S174 TaxID=3410790 RepID=UPI003BF616FC
MKKPTIIAGFLFLFLLQGCSSYLTSSENVSKTKNNYDKFLVVGRSKDNTARIKFENSVVSQLAEQGLNAVSSYSANAMVDINKKYSDSELASLKKKLMSNGYDGVIVTNLINTEAYTDVVPGSTSTAYVPARVGRFGRYLTYYPITTWEPDQLKSGTKYIFESSLYRLAESSGDNLQWVGRFEVRNPSSLEKTVSNYALDLTKALVKNSVSNAK